MTHVADHIITEAVRVIINTRDFCGNERDAVSDLAADHGLDKAATLKLFRIAKFRANAEWRQWQRLAGVPEKHIW